MNQVSFEVKVGLHQVSVLSPVLFVVVMDVVPSEARSSIPSELLYADDLLLMVPTMDQLGRRVAEWRTSLLDKGLKVNAGKSKLMVCSSGGKGVHVNCKCTYEKSVFKSGSVVYVMICCWYLMVVDGVSDMTVQSNKLKT